MRINMPVTNNERELHEGIQIVSKTDLQGIITYVNSEFVAVSGYSERELLGANHNIVRHPDMPAVAFSDLWTTIQRGEPWTGVVKNRCKNGDHYWVEANVTPIRDQGRITGYLSVRGKSTREQITTAEETYRMLREGRTPGRGIMARISAKAYMLSLHARVMIAMVGFLLIAGAAFGLWIQDEYRELLNKRQSALAHVVETAHGILEYFHNEERSGRMTTDASQRAALAAVRGLRYHDAEISEYFWIHDLHPRMLAHPFAPELEGQDISHITDSTGKQIFIEAVNIVHSSQEGLINYQWPKPGNSQAVAKVSFIKGFAPWNWIIGSGAYVDDIEAEMIKKATTQGAELLALLALLLGLTWFGLRYVRRGLDTAIDYFAEISAGNFAKKIHIKQRDELGHLLLALKAMQIKLSFDLNEANQRANAALRIQTALDNVSTNVMIANPHGEIIYLNRSMQEMMNRAAPDICQELPNFRPAALLGANIATFHRHPEHQKRILDNLQASHHAAFTIGSRSFELIANPIINSQGARLGTVVEWNDCTEKKQVQDEVQNLVNAAQGGDLSRRLNLQGKEGFLRNLAAALNQLLVTVEGAVTGTVTALGRMSHGDFTTQIEHNYAGAFARIREDTNATLHQLSILVGDIRTAAEAINSAAREIAIGNTDLSKRTEQQAAALEETSSTLEELTATVKHNAENANQANQFAQGARTVAEHGGNLVGKVVQTMGSITESANQISAIITVIESIAFQTNILALNAAVEAARAGEQGRGFAVVAAEVRNLAGRSATAAKEIKALIDASSTQVKEGSRLVGQAGQTMGEIVQAVKRVTDLMGEISSASTEQSRGIEQVNQAVSQMDDVTQQNAALVEQAASASESLQEQAEQLLTAVSQFQLASNP